MNLEDELYSISYSMAIRILTSYSIDKLKLIFCERNSIINDFMSQHEPQIFNNELAIKYACRVLSCCNKMEIANEILNQTKHLNFIQQQNEIAND